MNETAKLIADLVRAGTDPELIGRVAATIASVSKAEPIQSGAARRQAAYRQRCAERNALRNVDNAVTDKKGFDKEIPHTPLEITSKKITTTRGQKSDLPADWEPDAKTWALADELGFTSQEAWDQLDRMRDWAKNADGSKGRKSDWNAAFRNWIKRAADDKSKRPTQHGKATGNSRANNQDILDAIVREAERLEAEAGGGSLQDIDARAA